MHYAHSTEREDRSDWQFLADHLRAVAELAGDRGNKFGAGKAAQMCGWLHDLGKYSLAFQAYIAGRGNSVDHSTAGAREAISCGVAGMDMLVAELVAYAIAGHHAGLPDRQGVSASLDARLRDKKLPELDPIWKTEVEADSCGLFPPRFVLQQTRREQAAFQLAFLGRMIFSCLVDADFLDTERHYARVSGEFADRKWPSLNDHVDCLLSAFDSHMDGKLAKLSELERNAQLNILRSDILTHVRGNASMPKGIFTLEVPTGGGKTLASLAFALEHAKQWNMDRIVYSIPFTSIIDQTAQIFRGVLGENIILEHHSQIETKTIRSETENRCEDQMPEAKLRRAMENWDAPIVVTTNVQLFESLFAHRPSRCRKLHNLANAVIVLDEAQTIPLHVLRPCIAALDELARNYGCTIVLCTATQPALLAPAFVGGFEKTQELAPEPAQLHDAFRRVTLRTVGELSDDALIAELGEVEQGLVIVNSRKHALALYHKAKASRLEGLVHLTTRQTAADRKRILEEVRQALRDGEPCRVIATSLIEAGVDISFPRVWRAEAGLDQIIQAAGRCNREWERPKEESFVIVFRPTEAEPPKEIKDFAAAMKRVAPKHSDLFSQAAIEAYFQEVYWQKGDGLDRIPVKNLDGKDAQGSVRQSLAVSGGATNFSYRAVGEAFRLIKDGMEPVIIAIEDKPKDVLKALRGGMPASKAARELQSYLVQIPPNYRNALIENGHAAFVEGFDTQFVVLKTESFYSQEQGLVWEKADELGIEGNMI